MWLMGGGNWGKNLFLLNDVWSSEDGVHLDRVTDSLRGVAPRIWFKTVSYRGKLWVLGGYTDNPRRNLNDV